MKTAVVALGGNALTLPDEEDTSGSLITRPFLIFSSTNRFPNVKAKRKPFGGVSNVRFGI